MDVLAFGYGGAACVTFSEDEQEVGEGGLTAYLDEDHGDQVRPSSCDGVNFDSYEASNEP